MCEYLPLKNRPLNIRMLQLFNEGLWLWVLEAVTKLVAWLLLWIGGGDMDSSRLWCQSHRNSDGGASLSSSGEILVFAFLTGASLVLMLVRSIHL